MMNNLHHPKIYSMSQIKRVGDAGKIVREVLLMMGDKCKEGVTTKELDDIAFSTITKLGGKPACLGYKGFPASSCISINSVILHGIPDETLIKSGMLVGIDCPVLYKGMYADSAINVEVGEVDEKSKKLNNAVKSCLDDLIKLIKPNVEVQEISRFQEEYAKREGFKVIRNFRSHGVGKTLHEPPGIPHFLDKNNPYNNYKLKVGNIIAIEPTFVTNDKLILLSDGWAYKTIDNSVGTSWEHTIVITEKGNRILT
jgi:methionyl aminopeptidase